MLVMRPFWFGPLIPVYFLITAAVCGAAFAILITYFAYGGQAAMPAPLRELMRNGMPTVFGVALGITLIATAARVGSGLWPNFEGLEVWKHIIIATPWFWLEIAGLVIAFALMLSPSTRREGGMQVLAAGLVAVALFIGRYEYVVGGQLLPMFKGAWNAGYINYVPSFTEWMIVLLALSLTLGIWAYGEKRLNLSAMPEKV
jgi:molybdopterin-containing oxidoreductase family membrane subunit